MKKVLAFLSAAALVLCFATGGSAADFNLSGSLTVMGGSANNDDFTEGSSDPGFEAYRWMILGADFVASENLKAVTSFQLGDTNYGGAFGTSDAPTGGEAEVGGNGQVEIDNMYIDFNWPETEANLRLGTQFVNLPDSPVSGGSNIIYEIMPAMVVSSPVSDQVKMSAGWVRLASDLNNNSDASLHDDKGDLFFLTMPISFDNVEVTPHVEFAQIGQNAIDNSTAPGYWNFEEDAWTFYDEREILRQAGGVNTLTFEDDARAYYAGLSTTINTFDPIQLKWAGTYGSLDLGDVGQQDVDMSGFHTEGSAAFMMEGLTPEVFGFYSSGPDENDESINMFPALVPMTHYTSTYFHRNAWNDAGDLQGHGRYASTSMWGMGVKLKEIRLMEKLSSELQLLYVQGTAEGDIFTEPNDYVMNEDESIFEVSVNNEYTLYENLSAISELGWINMDEDDDYDGNEGEVEDNYKLTAGFKYSF